MTYKVVIIPQPIITPLPPAIAYLTGALGVKNSGCLFGISLPAILIHLRFIIINPVSPLLLTIATLTSHLLVYL